MSDLTELTQVIDRGIALHKMIRYGPPLFRGLRFGLILCFDKPPYQQSRRRRVLEL